MLLFLLHGLLILVRSGYGNLINVFEVKKEDATCIKAELNAARRGVADPLALLPRLDVVLPGADEHLRAVRDTVLDAARVFRVVAQLRSRNGAGLRLASQERVSSLEIKEGLVLQGM